MEPQDIDNRFEYHPADETAGKAHENVRFDCKLLAYSLNESLPECREKSLAITHLEEVMLWANAAIARHPH